MHSYDVRKKFHPINHSLSYEHIRGVYNTFLHSVSVIINFKLLPPRSTVTFVPLPPLISFSLSRLLVGLSVSFVCCLVAGVSVYFLCILNAITFIFCNNICAHRCRFSFGFIALDFPTEFSALFDSCGVIINLNNEIPKWNPIYNSFAVPAFSLSLSMQYIRFLCKFLTVKSSPKNRAHKMFQLIFCYQNFHFEIMHKTIFFGWKFSSLLFCDRYFAFV